MTPKYATYQLALQDVNHACQLMPDCRPGQAYCNVYHPEDELQNQIYFVFASAAGIAAMVYNYYQFKTQ